MKDAIRRVWPKWEVISKLGEGGYGRVYKVKRETFGEVTYGAVKVIKIPNSQSEYEDLAVAGFDDKSVTTYFRNQVTQLLDEIRTMEKMKSASHIVAIEDYEVVENEDEFGWTIFIRMELLENLRAYFKEHAITQDEVIKLGLHILTALDFCHECNIIHRDIKPDNIFISSFGEYKLGDFGIAREGSRHTTVMSQRGTYSYMSPEMFREGKCGKTVDLYALALTMYELLNHNRMPFLPAYPATYMPNDREEAVMKRLAGQDIPDIEGVDTELNAILKKACSPASKDRYRSAAEMKEALRNYLDKAKSQSPKQEEQVIDKANVEEEELWDDEKTLPPWGFFEEKEEIPEPEMTHNPFGDRKASDGWKFDANIPEEPVKEQQVWKQSAPIKEPLQTPCKHCGKTAYLQFTHGYACGNCGQLTLVQKEENTSKIEAKLLTLQMFPGDVDNQIKVVREMIEMDPFSAQLRSRLGVLLRQKGDVGSAIQQQIRALELDDRDANVYSNYSVCCIVQGDYEKALELLEKGYAALEKGDYSMSNAEVMFANYAVALQHTGNEQRAYEMLREAERRGYQNCRVVAELHNIGQKQIIEKLEYLVDNPKGQVSRNWKRTPIALSKAKVDFVIPEVVTAYVYMQEKESTGVVLASSGIYIKYAKLWKFIPWADLSKYKVESKDACNIVLRGEHQTQILIKLDAKEIANLCYFLEEMKSVVFGGKVVQQSAAYTGKESNEAKIVRVIDSLKAKFSYNYKADDASISIAKKYYKIPADEQIYGVFNYKVFGNCKEGIAIGKQGMYYRLFGKVGKVSWQEVSQCKVSKTKTQVLLEGPCGKVTLNAFLQVDIDNLFDIIKQMR